MSRNGDIAIFLIEHFGLSCQFCWTLFLGRVRLNANHFYRGNNSQQVCLDFDVARIYL